VIKPLAKKILNYFDFNKESEFDFEEYIFLNHKFRFLSERKGYRIFLNYDFRIYLIINTNNNEVLICRKKGKLFGKINFVPKGSLFVDLWINQTILSEIINQENEPTKK
jgi:hypothetical protein